MIEEREETLVYCKEEFAHVIMKAKKFYDLSHAGWKPRKVGGIVLDQEGLRTRKTDGVSPSPRAGED